jgi:hypothetical protein
MAPTSRPTQNGPVDGPQWAPRGPQRTPRERMLPVGCKASVKRSAALASRLGAAGEVQRGPRGVHEGSTPGSIGRGPRESACAVNAVREVQRRADPKVQRS